MRSFLFFSCLFFAQIVFAQRIETPLEQGLLNTTVTYAECIDLYQQLADKHEAISLLEVAPTDCGRPLSVVLVSEDSFTSLEQMAGSEKNTILIMNGIHPGEPEGIDASIMLVRDLLEDNKMNNLLQRVNVAVIPIYNVGGALNRNSHSRANQNGPEAYGFRGNARNLDLNRDFVKSDARNTTAFYQIFHTLRPEVFIDNHTSNGADYQYPITLISTQKDKLQASLAKFMTESLDPALYAEMEEDGYLMSPYVNSMKTIPDSGIAAFLDLPRYSIGYTSLFNTIGYTVETHMLKPFELRVWSTYNFMKILLEQMNIKHESLSQARQEADRQNCDYDKVDLNWTLDKSTYREINFHGYQAYYVNSVVTGLPQHHYNSDKPVVVPIRYFDSYKPTDSVLVPEAYIIPQAWTEVIDKLRRSGVKLHRLANDTSLQVDYYHIIDYQTTETPYEGHYLHHHVKVDLHDDIQRFFEGDYVVITNQTCKPFLAHSLEPQAPDSYFAWGFFDGILQQKEYFSPYVFEPEVQEMLANDPQLRASFEKKKLDDPQFANNAWLQLYFIYRNSKYYEKAHLRYPVYRFSNDVGLLKLNN